MQCDWRWAVGAATLMEIRQAATRRVPQAPLLCSLCLFRAAMWSLWLSLLSEAFPPAFLATMALLPRLRLRDSASGVHAFTSLQHDGRWTALWTMRSIFVCSAPMHVCVRKERTEEKEGRTRKEQGAQGDGGGASLTASVWSTGGVTVRRQPPFSVP